MPATAINPETVSSHNELADRVLALISALFENHKEFSYHINELQTCPFSLAGSLLTSLNDQLERLQESCKAINETVFQLDTFYGEHPDIVPTFGAENPERIGLNDIIEFISEKLPHASLLGNLHTVADELVTLVDRNIETLLNLPIKIT